MDEQVNLGISIPAGVVFSDLKLQRDPVTQALRFDWAPIEAVCAASGLDVAIFKESDEGNVIELLLNWYGFNLASGGPRDAVMEQVVAEVEAEAVAGMAGVQPGGGSVH
ncbi:MAG: hypothetical protein PHD19_11665 [Dechloromonas sp.]|nr:hypothetical protein [Dechloromonas sp.]